MDMSNILHLPSEAEKCAFFEKVFKEHKVAMVSADCVVKVSSKYPFWFRQTIDKVFLTDECCGYQIGNFAIVWKGRSNIPLFIAECSQPFELFSCGKYNFLLRKKCADDTHCFERYIWLPSEECYQVEKYEPDLVPEEFATAKRFNKHHGQEHELRRMYPLDDPETKSDDNRIFHDFIAKYWQE